MSRATCDPDEDFLFWLELWTKTSQHCAVAQDYLLFACNLIGVKDNVSASLSHSQTLYYRDTGRSTMTFTARYILHCLLLDQGLLQLTQWIEYSAS